MPDFQHNPNVLLSGINDQCNKTHLMPFATHCYVAQIQGVVLVLRYSVTDVLSSASDHSQEQSYVHSMIDTGFSI